MQSLEPAQPSFKGRVVVLISPCTVSTGEGVSYFLKQLMGAQVASFLGPTFGAFGILPGDAPQVIMPGNYELGYPFAQSVDGSGRVQLEANYKWQGGVSPTWVLPMTKTFILEKYTQGEDPLLSQVLLKLQGKPNQLCDVAQHSQTKSCS